MDKNQGDNSKLGTKKLLKIMIKSHMNSLGLKIDHKNFKLLKRRKRNATK